jgi:hypothetical protein
MKNPSVVITSVITHVVIKGTCFENAIKGEILEAENKKKQLQSQLN